MRLRRCRQRGRPTPPPSSCSSTCKRPDLPLGLSATCGATEEGASTTSKRRSLTIARRALDLLSDRLHSLDRPLPRRVMSRGGRRSTAEYSLSTEIAAALERLLLADRSPSDDHHSGPSRDRCLADRVRAAGSSAHREGRLSAPLRHHRDVIRGPRGTQ